MLLGIAAVVVLTFAIPLYGVWILAAVVVAGSIFLVIFALANRIPVPAPAIPEGPPEVPPGDPKQGSSPTHSAIPYATPTGEDRRTDPPLGATAAGYWRMRSTSPSVGDTLLFVT